MAFEQFTKNTLKEKTDSGTYERGESYFCGGRVIKIRLEDATLYATVAGSEEEYVVSIVDTRKDITFSCICPVGGCCKHVVAVGLTFFDQKTKIFEAATAQDKKGLSLKEHLMQLTTEELADLLILSLKTHKDWKSILLKQVGELLERKGSRETNSIYAEQFYTHLQRVAEILEERNEYGGGPDEDYEELNTLFGDLEELFIRQRLTEEHKREFFDHMFDYYEKENSGTEDMTLKTIYEVAATKDDWLFVIQKLQKIAGDNSYKKELIMDIYKDRLNDEETYLKLRKAQLHYGMDYYDLVQFYEQKGDWENALETAKIGLKRGQGRISDLLQFLFDYYKGRDYQQALIYARDIFKHAPHLGQYRELKKFVKNTDWKAIDDWCRPMLSKHELALLHLEEKKFDKVLSYVLDKPKTSYYGMSFSLSTDKDTFAQQLLPHYPNEMLQYYKEKVAGLIQQMGRGNYHLAAEYAQLIKEIYIKHLRQKGEWESFIQNIRFSNTNKRALLDEFKKL